jgi:hypothetical protein
MMHKGKLRPDSYSWATLAQIAINADNIIVKILAVTIIRLLVNPFV